MWGWVYILSLSRLLFSSLFVCKYLEREKKNWKKKCRLRIEIVPIKFLFWTKKIIYLLLLNNCIMMLFASDLCFICKYFQSRCNFVQLLQVFINNLMRSLQRTDAGRVKTRTFTWWWWGWWWRGVSVSVKSTAALFWATVSFCCQSLIAKEHINFSSRTGEDFTFLFICSRGFFPPFSKVFHSVGQAIKKKEHYHVKQLRPCLL